MWQRMPSFPSCDKLFSFSTVGLYKTRRSSLCLKVRTTQICSNGNINEINTYRCSEIFFHLFQNNRKASIASHISLNNRENVIMPGNLYAILNYHPAIFYYEHLTTLSCKMFQPLYLIRNHIWLYRTLYVENSVYQLLGVSKTLSIMCTR